MAKLNLTDEETQELYKRWREYHGDPPEEELLCDIAPAVIRSFQWGMAFSEKQLAERRKIKDEISDGLYWVPSFIKDYLKLDVPFLVYTQAAYGGYAELVCNRTDGTIKVMESNIVSDKFSFWMKVNFPKCIAIEGVPCDGDATHTLRSKPAQPTPECRSGT